jgi:hypothetical protein
MWDLLAFLAVADAGGFREAARNPNRRTPGSGRRGNLPARPAESSGGGAICPDHGENNSARQADALGGPSKKLDEPRK